jgi:hypothetical protein
MPRIVIGLDLAARAGVVGSSSSSLHFQLRLDHLLMGEDMTEEMMIVGLLAWLMQL